MPRAVLNTALNKSEWPGPQVSRAPSYFLKLADFVSLHTRDKQRLARGGNGQALLPKKKRKEENSSGSKWVWEHSVARAYASTCSQGPLCRRCRSWQRDSLNPRRSFCLPTSLPPFLPLILQRCSFLSFNEHLNSPPTHLLHPLHFPATSCQWTPFSPSLQYTLVIGHSSSRHGTISPCSSVESKTL